MKLRVVTGARTAVSQVRWRRERFFKPVEVLDDPVLLRGWLISRGFGFVGL